MEIKLEFDDGKYTYCLESDGNQYALRYGERWRDLCGDKLIFLMAGEITELKLQLEEGAAKEPEMRAAGFENAQDLFTSYLGIKLQLAESQAREARLREALTELSCLGNGNVPGNSIGNGIAREALVLPHDDTALNEYRDAVIEKCAVIAANSCLVPPDGGSPTVEEVAVSEEAARRIRTMRTARV